MPKALPAESRLPENANLENLKKRARQLLKDVLTGDPEACARLARLLPRVRAKTTLSDTQLAIAREYGLSSWPKLKATVEAQQSTLGQASGASRSGGGERISATLDLPLLPLRDLVVFPGMQVPIFVGRSKSLRAIDVAASGAPIFLCMQHDGTTYEPSADEIYRVGTLATITQRITLADGTVKLLVHGDRRGRALRTDFSTDHGVATVQVLDEPSHPVRPSLITRAQNLFLRVAELLALPDDLATEFHARSEPGPLVDFAAQTLRPALQVQQELLELIDPAARLKRALAAFDHLLTAIEHPPLDDFVGRYQMVPGLVIEVQRQGTGLVAESPWGRHQLCAEGEDRFVKRPEADFDRSSAPLSPILPMTSGQAKVRYIFRRDPDGLVADLTRGDLVSTWSPGRRLAQNEDPKPALALPPSLLSRYTGRYEFGPDQAVTLKLEEGQLSVEKNLLVAISETEFFGMATLLRISFKLNRVDDVIGMSTRGPKGNLRYCKVA